MTVKMKSMDWHTAKTGVLRDRMMWDESRVCKNVFGVMATDPAMLSSSDEFGSRRSLKICWFSREV
jgi:hypothetical protein